MHVTIELTRITCLKCGCTFAMQEEIRKQRAQDGKKFYCTSGCDISYGESDMQKEIRNLNHQINDLYLIYENACGRARSERMTAISYKSHFKRLKNKLDKLESEKNR